MGTDPETPSCTENSDKWTEVRYKRRNMRLKDYQILILKYNSDSGTWRDASDIYEDHQPGYVPRDGDWKCVLCHNINFEWRRLCNNPNCRAPKDFTLKKAEKDVPDVSSEPVEESPPIKEDVEAI